MNPPNPKSRGLKKIVQYIERGLSNYSSLVGLISFILAILAFFLSYTQGLKLDQIEERIPTRTVSSFPGNLVTINEEILKKFSPNSDELLICSDVPAYGFLSNYPEYEKYEKNLLSIVIRSGKDFKLHLSTYSDSLLRDEVDWQFIKARDTIVKYFHSKKYWTQRETEGKLDAKDLAVKDYPSFKQFIVDRHNELIDKLQKVDPNKVVVTRLTKEMPFFMWLENTDKILVSFPNYSNNKEHAFYSVDSEIIKNFKEIFFLIENGVY
ncbi:MAG: hypothetical protein CMP48_06195 [Rickettsiales bacterium]|nr:hypothetical protein [Rickettsiales bacterium]